MSFSFSRKKHFLFLLLIIILLAGGFFYWQNQKPTPPEEWDTAEVSPREDYKIVEQEDGLLVKNEKAGLSFKLPEGWEFEENFSTSSGSGGVSFASPNMVTATRTSVVKEGCRFKTGIAKIKTTIDALKKKMPERFSSYPNVILVNQRKIKVQNQEAIKHVFKDEKYEMNYITVHIPKEDKVHEMFLDTAIDDKKKCEQNFDEILNTISIE